MEQDPKNETAESESETKEKAFTHLAQGKRHLLVKDYNEAVTSLAMACTLLTKLYGDFASECGEAYFNYGKALLELARIESGVLGIEGEHEDNEDSDEDEDDGEEEKETQTAENNEDKEDSENGTATNDKEGEEKSKVAEEEKEKPAECKEEEEEEEEEDLDNLHLAWEMLEMAKIVFEKQAEDNKQMSLKLAEVHLKLGEVSLESENYSQGIDEIKTCLDIQLQNLDKHDRYIAETHYQLGIAYTLSNEFDKAIEQYKHAHELLEKRIVYLQDKEKQGVPNEEHENNPFYSIKEEISEINALLPEVKEKISDVEDHKKETMKALLAGITSKKCSSEDGSAAGQGTSTDSSSTTTGFPVPSSESTAKPVSNISHLVRKKRKLETDSPENKNCKHPSTETSPK